MEAHLAVRLTIWAAVIAWVAAEWRRSEPGARLTTGRSPWTIGAAAALVHTALAFHLHHGWSHDAALAETARQTAALTGWSSGAGLFANYAFVGLWAADVSWWWLWPGSFSSRPAWLDAAVRAFLWFMFVNGAFVFVSGPRRWAGAAAAVAVAVAWYRGRARRA
jgi:hypothetical protein